MEIKMSFGTIVLLLHTAGQIKARINNVYPNCYSRLFTCLLSRFACTISTTCQTLKYLPSISLQLMIVVSILSWYNNILCTCCVSSANIYSYSRQLSSLYNNGRIDLQCIRNINVQKIEIHNTNTMKLRNEIRLRILIGDHGYRLGGNDAVLTATNDLGVHPSFDCRGEEYCL